jgi:hypothetical protein
MFTYSTFLFSFYTQSDLKENRKNCPIYFSVCLIVRLVCYQYYCQVKTALVTEQQSQLSLWMCDKHSLNSNITQWKTYIYFDFEVYYSDQNAQIIAKDGICIKKFICLLIVYLFSMVSCYWEADYNITSFCNQPFITPCLFRKE